MENQKKYDEVRNAADRSFKDKVGDCIGKISYFMPNGIIELPLRHNGRSSYAKGGLCFVPCICLVFLLIYTGIALSRVGKIKMI